MVFSEVRLIVGFVVNSQELEEKVFKEPVDEDGYMEQVLSKNKNTGKITLYNFPCCSEINQRQFIIGRIVKRWVRKCARCDQCEEYSLCDNCIGQTEYGYYDVDKILNQVVECPIENVCMYCWRDNKAAITEACQACGHKPNWNMRFNWQQDNKFEDQVVVKQITAYKNSLSLDQPVKIYYSIDDCLSCT